MKAKTYALDDIIVVVMRGSGFTALEQTIMDHGEPNRVLDMRQDFQRVMAGDHISEMRRLQTGKLAHASRLPDSSRCAVWPAQAPKSTLA